MRYSSQTLRIASARASMPAWVVAFGGVILSLLGGYLADHDQEELNELLLAKTSQNAELTERLAESADESKRLGLQIARKADESAALQERIAGQAHEITRLYSELAKNAERLEMSVTGGDSFCYLSVASSRDSLPFVVLVHQGEYPLYDINARIVDLKKFEGRDRSPQTLFQVFSDEDFNGKVVRFPELHDNAALSIGPILGVDGDQARFNIFFSARNGFYSRASTKTGGRILDLRHKGDSTGLEWKVGSPP